MKKTFAALTSLIIIISSSSIAFAEEAVEAELTPTPPDLTSSSVKSNGFTLVPAYPNTINPRKFIFELQPGAVYTDYVLVKNLSSEPAFFVFYGADPTFTNQGTPAYKTRESGINEEGAWIKFDKPRVLLQGQEEKLLSFRLLVPSHTEPGDYRAGITMEKTRPDARNQNITIATRMIVHADIKITNSPSEIPRETEPPQKHISPWHPFYLWITLILFVVSLVALIWTSAAEKKARKKAAAARARQAGTKKTTRKSTKKK